MQWNLIYHIWGLYASNIYLYIVHIFVEKAQWGRIHKKFKSEQLYYRDVTILVNIKKLLISKRRIGILKNYLNKVKIVRVCDFITFEIPILTVAESMINYIYIF